MIQSIVTKLSGYIRGRLLVYFALLVVLILLISIIPLYLTYTAKLKTQITEINSSLLSQTQGGLDQLLREIDRTSLKLSEDINMKRYIFMTKNNLFSDEVERQQQLRKVYDVMNNEERYYTSATSIYLYVKEANTVITSSQAVPLDAFIERDFVDRTATANANKEWTGVRESSLTEIHGRPVASQVITLSRMISNDGVLSDAMLFIDVEVKLLNQFFQDFKSDYPLALLISDSKGQPVYASQKQLALSEQEMIDLFQDEAGKEAGGDDYIISRISSGYNNWTYSVAVPRTWLFSSMKFISQMTFILTTAVLLFGLLVSYLLVKRYYKPFERTLRKWNSPHARHRGNTVNLHAIVDDLVTFNQQYGEVVAEHRGMLKNKILLDILKHNDWHESELIPIALQRDASPCMVACLLLDETQELSERDKDLVLLAAANIVQESLLMLHVVSEAVILDNRCMAVILCLPEAADAAARQQLMGDVRTTLSKYIKYSWTIGLGNLYEQAASIPLSYREAMAALHHRIHYGKGSMIDFGELAIEMNDQIHDDDWLPIKEQIVAAIRAKDAVKLEDSLQNLCDTIQCFIGAPMSHVSYIFHSILLDIEKMMFDLNINKSQILTQGESVYVLMDRSETVIELKELFAELGRSIIAFLDSKAFAAKSSFIQSITDYMEAHYRDDLGLDAVADQFAINPSYLGQLMKKELHVTFLQHLTEIRLREGKRLLAETNKKINEIGAEIGYPNRSTFIRVFKQHVGVTPSEYRNGMLMSGKHASS